MGFWWGGREIEGGSLYLQLEETKLCAKVHVPSAARRRHIRETWSARVLARSDLRFSRPPRFGSGQWMTVALYEGDYRQCRPDGLLDLGATCALLRRVTALVAEVASTLG